MRRSTLGSAALALLLPAALAAQAPRKVADGVYLLANGAAWVDLGPDVLAITDDPADIPAVRRASRRPVRAVFSPNGAVIGGATQILPAAAGPGAAGFRPGALGFQGTLTLGATRRVEIRELDPGAGTGQAVVWIPDARVLFVAAPTGGRVPERARIETTIIGLERLARLEPRIVVSGGTAGGPELLERGRSILVAARAHVERGLEAGRSADEIVGDAPADAGGKTIVERTYRELVGLVPPAMIDELELKPGKSPTARTPGWTRPKAVVVRDLWPGKPGRIAELGRVAPGVEIRIAKTAAEAATLVADADASVGWFNPEIMQRATRLRWVQAPSAGVEGMVRVPGFAESPIVLTNAQRIYGPPVAEHAVSLLLGLSRRLQTAVRLQDQHKWADADFPPLEMPELHGRTLLIAGLGGLGTEVARIARGFGMRVIGTRNLKGEPSDLAEYVGGADELATLARQADFIVNCLPLTSATTKVFNAALFDAMKPTAFFVNVGRGGSVDTDALMGALREKKIAGAGFDVTDPEPLPPDHPLWTFPNVIITPHVGSSSVTERERLWLLVRENLRRFVAGEPLLAVVDKRAGY